MNNIIKQIKNMKMPLSNIQNKLIYNENEYLQSYVQSKCHLTKVCTDIHSLWLSVHHNKSANMFQTHVVLEFDCLLNILCEKSAIPYTVIHNFLQMNFILMIIHLQN